MNRENRFLRTKDFFRNYDKVWPKLGINKKAQLLDKSAIPACYVVFFDGVYDALYRNPINNAVDCINELRSKGIILDELDTDNILNREKIKEIEEQTGYKIDYLKGVYEVMFLERPELFNKRPSTEKKILEK